MQRRTFLALLAIIAVPVLGQEASMPTPFGIKMAAPLSALGKVKEIAPGKYVVESVAKPHSDFEQYIVQAAPKAGVCWVKAIGKTVQTSAYGNELRAKFSEIEAQITSVYGPSNRMDFLRSGALWSAPREWMMSLMQGERVLLTVWQKKDSSNLPEGVSVYLSAKALSTSTGLLTVEYSFPNDAECEAEVKEAQKRAF